MTTPKQPTQAEINEAADTHVKSLDSYMSDYPRTDHIAHSTWVKAVSWLQNYQAQPTTNEMNKEINKDAIEYCKSIGSSITGAAYSAYMAGSRQKSSIVVFKDATYLYCWPNETWEYENDDNWLLTIPSTQNYQPQQQVKWNIGIEQLLDDYTKEVTNNKDTFVSFVDDGENDGIGKVALSIVKHCFELLQQSVKQFKSFEQILKEHGVIEYDVRTNAAMHEYASQFQTPAIGISEGSQCVSKLIQRILDYLHENITASVDYIDFYDFSKGIEGAMVDSFPETVDELLAEIGETLPPAPGQPSQPQPNAISVIEGEIKGYKSEQEYHKDDAIYCGLLNIKIDTLENLLTKLKKQP